MSGTAPDLVLLLLVLSPPGLLSPRLQWPRQVLWVLPTHPRSAGLATPTPDPAGLSHPRLCVTRALLPHNLQTHPESAGPGDSTPGTPRGGEEAARRPPAEIRSPASVPRRPASRADVALGGAGLGPNHRGAGGERRSKPGPPVRPCRMVRPGWVKAPGRRCHQPRRHNGASRGRSTGWDGCGPDGRGPGGAGGTPTKQRRSGRQHPLGLHRHGAQCAAESAHPAAAVCAGPGEGAESSGHDPGEAPGRPGGGRALEEGGRTGRERELVPNSTGAQQLLCDLEQVTEPLCASISSLEQGGLDKMIKITIANSYKDDTCSVFSTSCQAY